MSKKCVWFFSSKSYPYHFELFFSTNLDNVSPSDKCACCDKSSNPEKDSEGTSIPENKDGTEVWTEEIKFVHRLNIDYWLIIHVTRMEFSYFKET
jgi:hypothetical protein